MKLLTLMALAIFTAQSAMNPFLGAMNPFDVSCHEHSNTRSEEVLRMVCEGKTQSIQFPNVLPHGLTPLISIAKNEHEEFEIRMIIQCFKDYCKDNGHEHISSTTLLWNTSGHNILDGWGALCRGSISVEEFLYTVTGSVMGMTKYRHKDRDLDEFCFNTHRFENLFRSIFNFIHQVHPNSWQRVRGRILRKLPIWPFRRSRKYFKNAGNGVETFNLNKLNYDQDKFIMDVRENLYTIAIFQAVGCLIHHEQFAIGLLSRSCIMLYVYPTEYVFHSMFLSTYLVDNSFGISLEAKATTMLLLYYAFFRESARWIFACRRYKSLCRCDRDLYRHIVLLQALLKPWRQWYDPILYFLQALLCAVNDFEKTALLWIRHDDLREEVVKRFGFGDFHQAFAIAILLITSFDLGNRLNLPLPIQAAFILLNYALGVATHVVGSKSEVHQYWQAWFLFSSLLADVHQYCGLAMQIIGGARLLKIFLREKQVFKQNLHSIRERGGVQNALFAPFQSFIASGEFSN